jgi:hypothetical protein
MILLDNIQLPFLLSSVLFALYATSLQNSKRGNIKTDTDKSRIRYLLILISGTLLGISIFTRIPAFTMIPFVAYLIYSNKDARSLKDIVIWITPVLVIPLIWPLNAAYAGEFDLWLEGINYQTDRHFPLIDWLGWYPELNSLELLLRIDPVFMIFGLASLAFALIKRDVFLLLWIFPFLIFSYFIGYVFFFHLITIFPAFCVAIARLITDIPRKIKSNKIRLVTPYITITVVATFGLVSTLILIVTDINATHLSAAAFLAEHFPSNDQLHQYELTVIRGAYRFFWIFSDVEHNFQFFPAYWDTRMDPIKTEKVVFMIEEKFDWWKDWGSDDVENVRKLIDLCNSMNKIVEFKNDAAQYDYRKYPYTSMIFSLGLGSVEIRANDEATSKYFNDSSFSAQTEPCGKSRQTKYDISTEETILYDKILQPVREWFQN